MLIPPKPGKGFDANKYNSTSIKAGKKLQRNTKEIRSPGVNPIMRQSDKLNARRVSTTKLKPMSMTYGTTSGGKGSTKVISRKRA